jgi:chondroitin synthase
MDAEAYPGNDYSFLEELRALWQQEYSIKASIVLTTYNMKQVVEKTLCGLRLQTYPKHLFEVVISDDGSNDGIEELASKYERLFEHLIFVRQEHKGYRLATVRNHGIKVASNEVIVSLDGDVLPSPGLLEAHLRWFHLFDNLATIGYIKYVDTSFVSPNQILTSFEVVCGLPDYPSVSNWGAKLDRRLPEFVDFKHHLAPYNCFHGGNCAFRRQHALEIGLFDEDFNVYWGYEDLEFGYRLWKSGKFLILEPDAIGFHQERETLTLEERRRQRNINFEKMSRKVPGFREYREQIGR